MRREETVPVALLLALAGGYLDLYTWIIHGVMENAQTANLVLLWGFGRQLDGGAQLRAAVGAAARDPARYAHRGRARGGQRRRPARIASPFRMFAALCVMLGVEAAVGAFGTTAIPDLVVG